jgi:hypothetical protein
MTVGAESSSTTTVQSGDMTTVSSGDMTTVSSSDVLARLPTALLCNCVSYMTVAEMANVSVTCLWWRVFLQNASVPRHAATLRFGGGISSQMPNGVETCYALPALLRGMRLARLTACDARLPLTCFGASNVQWRTTLRDLTIAPYGEEDVDNQLQVKGAHVVEPVYYAALRSLERLEILRIRSASLTSVRFAWWTLDLLARTLTLPSLTYLDLRGANCTKFTPLGALSQLRVLDLMGCGNIGVNETLRLPPLPLLRALRTSGFVISDRTRLPSLPSLVELHFTRGTRPRANLAEIVASTVASPTVRLRMMCMSGYRWLTVRDVKQVLSVLPTLEILRLAADEEPPQMYSAASLRQHLESFTGHRIATITTELLDEWADPDILLPHRCLHRHFEHVLLTNDLPIPSLSLSLSLSQVFDFKFCLNFFQANGVHGFVWLDVMTFLFLSTAILVFVVDRDSCICG